MARIPTLPLFPLPSSSPPSCGILRQTSSVFLVIRPTFCALLKLFASCILHLHPAVLFRGHIFTVSRVPPFSSSPAVSSSPPTRSLSARFVALFRLSDCFFHTRFVPRPLRHASFRPASSRILAFLSLRCPSIRILRL